MFVHRPFLKISVLVLTLYLISVWAKILQHPPWLLPGTEILALVILLLTLAAGVRVLILRHRTFATTFIAPPPSNLVPQAIERKTELKRLHRQLLQAHRPLVLCGIGGLGKTTMAQMFGYHYKSEFRHVAWLSAVAVFTAEEEYRDANAEYFLRAFTDNVGLKKWINVVFDPLNRPVDHFRQVLAKLAEVPGPNLLIVDNAPEITSMYAEDLSILMESWSVLITARSGISNMDFFELEALTDQEALNLFWSIYEGSRLSQKGDMQRREIPELLVMLQHIAHHTLTIELLAAYAREKKLAVRMLCAEVMARGLNHLEGYDITIAKSGKIQPLHAHLRDTFLLDLNSAELELMRYFSILPPDGSVLDGQLMQADFLCDLFGKSGDSVDFINQLRALSRLRWLVEREDRYACHPVIADTARLQLKPNVENCTVLVKHVTDLIQPDTDRHEHSIYRAKYAPLAAAVFNSLWKEKADFSIADNALATLGHQLGKLYQNLGNLYQALDVKKKVVAIREKVLNHDHPDLATSYSGLAIAYGALDQSNQKLEYNLKALDIRQKVLPPDHPELAQTYNNIATCYTHLGDTDKRLAYHLKAKEIREKVLPPDHLDLAESYSNLGGTYRTKRALDESLAFHHKALAIREKVLPPDHPVLANTYNNLGLAYRTQRDYQKSLEYYQKALAIREKSLPPLHPKLAQSYNNIAGTYRNLGEPTISLSYHEKALIIREATLPPNHKDLASLYFSLGLTYRDLGDLAKAAHYLQQTVLIREKSYPPGHKDTQKAREWLTKIQSENDLKGMSSS